MKKVLFGVLTVLLAACTAMAQWTQLPHAAGSFGTSGPGARPFFSGYNRLVYDQFVHASFVRDRINQCGDPFTNSDWWWFTATNVFQNIGWSGGGANINGKCTSPVVETDPQIDGVIEPGDRHPYHQYTTDGQGHIYLTSGVDDGGNCTGGTGICSYHDMWVLDDSTQAWKQLASLSYSTSEGVLEAAPILNQVFLFGGLVGGNAVNWVSRYDVASNTWTKDVTSGQRPPTGEDGPGFIWDPDDQVFIIWGGHSCATCAPDTAHAVFYSYNPATQVFTKLLVSSIPDDVFPKMDWDTRRHEIVLYIPGSGVWSFVPSLQSLSFIGFVNGPQIYSGERNSLTMTYDSDKDLHLVHSYGCNCYWTLQLP